ncbi:RHS repeat-associated core domain-containing protein [Lysobacter enzymogenes]|uniref:RHS repeat-associated core domain-containing protein n=1 Tax=Lysobacter enzymogenes TaxID=69 RepID=UPI001AF1640D|nr:RHS repeat-associated core domain-containing protein [Lysobacter enzymogenes]QQQ00876.1 RHS repeat protein [Lysobacter enzymogenes]
MDNLLPGVRESRPLNYHVAGMVVFKNRVDYKYELSPEKIVTGSWTYIGGGTTFEEAEAREKAKYDKQSTDAGCAPNTSFVWETWQPQAFGPNGDTTLEERKYTVKYQVKDFGTVCKSTTLRNSLTYIMRGRDIACPNTMATIWNASQQACVGIVSTAFDHRKRYSGPILPTSKCDVGNPCDPSTGDKMQPEPDFDLGWISFTRYFHSLTTTPMSSFGDGWTHSHNLRLTAGEDPTSSSGAIHVGLIEADGSQLSFTEIGNAYEADNGSGDRVVKDSGLWYLYRGDRVLLFDADGRLKEQQFEDGTGLTYAYDGMSRLSAITHSSGRSLTFEYAGDNRVAPLSAIRSAGAALATYTYTTAGQVETVTYADAKTRRYHYEDTRFPRYLTGVTGEDEQRYSTFAYDAKGRVISSQHAGGADGVALSYPATGGTVVTDALGEVTTFGLTGDTTAPPKINGINNTSGTAATTYNDEATDFRRRVASITDRKGTETRYAYAEGLDPDTYDPNRIETITEAYGKPEQRVRTVVTDTKSNRLSQTTIGNRLTRINRNSRMQPDTVTVRDTATNAARTTTYAYCESADVSAANSACPILGLLKSVDGPRTDVSDVTTFEYYGSDDSTCATTPALCTYRKGDLRKTIDALGRATEVLGYDPQGRPLSVLDANGVVTDYEYTARGWLTATKVRGADNAVETDDRITRIEHEPDGLVKKVTLPGGVYTRYTYNAARQLTDVIDNAGNTIHYTLDLAGNIKQQDTKTASGALKHTLSRVFNTLGQLQTLKDSAQNATGFAYDNNGNPREATDALGRVTTQTYDPLDRLGTTLQDAGGLAAETKLQYTALDQIAKVTDPNGLSTAYVYNGFGDRTKLTSPDTGITNYTYNEAGLLATKKDANDAAANRYTYDALGRPKAIFYTAAGPADVEYDYDTVNAECTAGQTFALGRLTASRTEGNELKYCYDRFGQVVRKVQIVSGKSFTLKYAYTIGGHLYTVTYPDGTTVDYARDTQARIKEIGVRPYGGTRTVLLNNAAYEPFGPVAGWTYGNGRTLSRTYDLDYRPKTIFDAASGGLSLGYGYNTIGELIELKDGLQSASLAGYEYDTLGRLTKTLDGVNPMETYSYDKTGNRKSLLHGGITDAYVYPATNHRLSSVAGVARAYNAVGNTTSVGGTAKQYVYNANDRLSQFKQAGAIRASYRYNAISERVATTGATTTAIDTYTLYDESGNWIGDYDSAGAAKQQAVWFGSAPVGLVVGSGSTQTLQYVQPDHLGTPRAVIDPNRNVAIWTWDAKSEAFGNSPPNQDPDLDGTAFEFNMRFPGQRYDATSGLIYNYFRDYDPSVGRYLQSDPIGLQGGISTYAYAFNAPATEYDPYGLAPPGRTATPTRPRPPVLDRMAPGASRIYTRKEFTERFGPFTGEVERQLDRGCVGVASIYQNMGFNMPENAPGAQCFKTQDEADRKAKECKSDMVWVKQGIWRNKNESTITPHSIMGKKGNDPNNPSEAFNYITWLPDEELYVIMNYRIEDVPANGPQLIEVRSSHNSQITPNSTYPNQIFCTVCSVNNK